MFVVEDRNGSSAVLVHVDDLVEELPARVFCLALFILRVIPVLANEYDTVHAQFARPEREGLRDGGIHFHGRELDGAAAAEIPLPNLIDVKRYHIHLWLMVCTAPPVSVKIPYN